jgi:hypothetical protein
MSTWLDDEIDFYDFIWKHGVSMCPEQITGDLINDIETGGGGFEEMKAKILETFPTKEDAIKAFKCYNK